MAGQQVPTSPTARPATHTAVEGDTALVTPRSLAMRMWLSVWNLRPTALFLGPVFERDVAVMGRRKATYINRAGYTLLLAVVITIAFSQAVTSNSSRTSPVERAQEFQRVAPVLAIALAWVQFVLLILIAPLLTAPAICDEKRNRTLAVLACTPLTSAQIVMSTFTSRLVQLVLLALVSLPLLLGARVFGGLDASAVFATTAVTVTSVLLSASFGLLASVFVKRSSSAVTVGIGMFVLVCGLPLGAILFWAWVNGTIYAGPPPGIWSLTYISPVFSMIENTIPGYPWGGGREALWTVTLGSIGLSVLCCIAASIALRRVMIREAASDGGSTQPVSRSKQKTKASTVVAVAADEEAGATEPGAVESADTAMAKSGAIGAGGANAGGANGGAIKVASKPEREMSHSRTVSDTPVLWREMHQPAFRTRTVAGAMIVLGAIFLFVAYYNDALKENGFDAFMGVALTVVCTLMATGATAGAVGQEIQARTWPVLVATPLPPREIIWGKLLGGVRRQWPLVAFYLVHSAIGLVFGVTKLWLVVLVVAMVAATVFAVSSLGVLLSVLIRKTTSTMAVCFLTVVSVWLILPISFKVLGEIYRGGMLGTALDEAADWLILPNPATLTIVLCEGLFSTGRAKEFRLPSGSAVTFGELMLMIGMFVGIMLLLGCLFARLAQGAFDRAKSDNPGG